MGLVQSQAGVGGVVLGLGGKDGRAGINVWGFQKVRSRCSMLLQSDSEVDAEVSPRPSRSKSYSG